MPHKILSVIVFKTIQTPNKPPPQVAPAEGMGDAGV